MLRHSLPLILRASAVAFAGISVLLGLLGYDNPLQLIVFIVGGIAVGAVVAGIAGILESATAIAAAIGTIQADQRQQTRVLLTLTEDSANMPVSH